ncbi:MAG: TonB-dependent receptor, partial [Bacteroidota bacterium]
MISIIKECMLLHVLSLLVYTNALGYYQEDPLDVLIDIGVTNQPYANILKQLETQGDFTFAYQSDRWVYNKKSISFTQMPLREVLKALFEGTGITFFSKGSRVYLVREKREERQGRSTLNGYFRDAETGETLIGATLMVKELPGRGTVSNAYGYYAMNLPVGSYEFIGNYIGYTPFSFKLDLYTDTTISISLEPSTAKLQEVVVEGKENPEDRIWNPQMGKTAISIETLKKVPTVAGEPDVMKVLQLTSGVLTKGEGSSTLFVRGGSGDQNLILLDEAPVYNPSHLMGFFSVFNSDALKEISFFRGGIPAQYGGRLSSVLDIRMKEGNNKKFAASGGIGTLASRLTFEGPIKKEKSSFIISARRTYADLFLKFSQDEFSRNTAVYFYDFNAKTNFRLGEKDKIFISGYFGRDVNKVSALQYIIDWGNATATARWNHIFSSRLFSNTTLLYSNYNYLIDLSDNTSLVNWKSNINNVTFKQDFSWYVNPEHLISFGLHTTYHRFQPGYSENKAFEVAPVPKSHALEHALYIADEYQPSERIHLHYGLRYSLFQLLSADERILYGSNGEITELIGQSNKRIYKNYGGFEPRINISYQLSRTNSVKLNYQHTRQYLHTLTNTNLAFNVFDIWIPASQKTKPQIADQVAVGYLHQLNNAKWEFKAEIYAKQMQNQIYYKDHSRLIMNRYIEGELLSGDAEAYGLELQLHKNTGKLTGWLNYTYSRVFIRIEGIENGEKYPASYDQPHNLQAILQYQFSKRVNLSANWVYQSGRPITHLRRGAGHRV